MPILATVNLSAKSRTRHLRWKLLDHIVCAYTSIQLPVSQVTPCLRWSGLGPSGDLLLRNRQNKKILFVGYSASCQQETWAEMSSSRSSCKLEWCICKAMSPLLCTVKVVPGTGGVLRLPQVHVEGKLHCLNQFFSSGRFKLASDRIGWCLCRQSEKVPRCHWAGYLLLRHRENQSARKGDEFKTFSFSTHWYWGGRSRRKSRIATQRRNNAVKTWGGWGPDTKSAHYW